MKIPAHLFNFIFATLFCIHSNAWASGSYQKVDPKIVQQLVLQYNSLSSEMRKAEFRKMSAVPDGVKWDELTLPDIQFKQNKIHFSIQAKDYSMTLFEDGMFSMNGNVYDTKTPVNEWGEAVPKTSFLDHFVSSAHALEKIKIIAVIVAAIIAFLLYMFGRQSGLKKIDVTDPCTDFKNDHLTQFPLEGKTIILREITRATNLAIEAKKTAKNRKAADETIACFRKLRQAVENNPEFNDDDRQVKEKIVIPLPEVIPPRGTARK